MSYDAIVIGGGHNGLVCAAYLGKAGLKTLVLERRATLGGVAATEEIFPGFKVNIGSEDAALFLPKIVDELSLGQHGLEFLESPAALFAPRGDGSLTLWQDIERSCEAIAAFSTGDANRFAEFCRSAERYASVLRAMLTLTPPDIKDKSLSDALPWAKVALKIKGLGKRDMMQFLRTAPMSVREFLDEWFEDAGLKGALAPLGIRGSMQGPYAYGTAFLWLYYHVGAERGRFLSHRPVRGGIGRLSDSLAKSAAQFDVEIRNQAEVSEILVEDYRAIGVKLKNGEEITAKHIISNADPQRTFLKTVGAPKLGPQFVRKVRNLRYRGVTSKLILALSGLPEFKIPPESTEALAGRIVICPDLEYLERAYDDAKYGRFSRRPYLDIVIPTLLDPSLAPSSKHLMSVTAQYTPYQLRDAAWEEQKPRLAEHLMKILSEHITNLMDIVEDQHLITPRDWERDYGLTEGCIYHGQMALDQLLFMRPVPDFGRYRTPIESLYLCGAGTHPGGGVTGAPGHNCAREVLRDCK